ncbi:sulfotransferase [Tamlana sp. 2_MG-2023]|uniref:sulfotransferase n=1 Tax=unclassified Tamlana TaxID=2614803 RepID=UPI0026E3CD11|nr:MULTISPECIES: sulfotransferase [unclassified Tamlana]MDO6758737.1 sulfotransferase [Tamlana sp. 2_MG-2023]MDO6789436.1 sulfotransferase [Tamlana sp. 1_MG-2023]
MLFRRGKVRKHKEKIFCIGRNKTGTTSLESVLGEFGYKLGDQIEGEMLVKAYANKDWGEITNFCESAEAFQDAPFSWPYTWLFLYNAYPKAKFILTIRDTESWYESITRFHSKIFANGERIPNKEDLLNANYRYEGFVWETSRAVWKTPENDVYNKEMFIRNYIRHNEDVIHFFKDNSNFLCIDVTKKGSYKELADFLNKKMLHQEFPHLNKTQ